MNIKNIFKRFIILDLILIIITVVAYFFQSEIALAFNEQVNPENEVTDMLVVISLMLLIVYFLNLYLLYKFNPMGKKIYLPLIIIGLIISLLSGTNAVGPVLYVIEGLGWANTGAILALLYFSPIKKEFGK